MTAPADRCPTCDRAECEREEAHRDHLEYPPGWTGWLQDWQMAEKLRLVRVRDAAAADCAAHRLDWRSESLASRALLREAERNVAIVGPRSRDLDLAARIREHLRGL